MSKALNQIRNTVMDAGTQFHSGNISSQQAVSDIAVTVMSYMTRIEIENALYMAIGAEGVGDLVSSTLSDLQAVQQSDK